MDLVINLLHKISGIEISLSKTESIQQHVEKITTKLYNYKSIGFVNSEVMELNEIYTIYRILYPEADKMFKSTHLQSLFELEHFHNMILLILILEIDICLEGLLQMKYRGLVDEDIDDLKTLRNRLLKNVTAPLRSSLSSNSLSYLKRIYTAFDTEYYTIDLGLTDLLCLTIHIGMFIRVKPLKLDWTITNYRDTENKPKTCDLIEVLIRVIRLVNNKKDDKVFDLVNNLKSNSEVEEVNGVKLYRYKNVLTPSTFINNYFDLTSRPEFHSFKTLMDISLNKCNEMLNVEQSRLTELLIESGIDVETNRLKTIKEIYLLAHFTTADISSWSDFEEVKEDFGILRNVSSRWIIKKHIKDEKYS